MEEIKNREELNKYYNIVRDAMDEYFKFNISPLSLKKYLKNKKNLSRFKKENELSRVKNIDKVIRDVLDDKIAMFSIKKFDNYSYNLTLESIDTETHLFRGLEEPTDSYDKAVANKFGVDLQYIELIDTEKHIFRVDDPWEPNEFIVMVLSNNDLMKIKRNLFNETKNKLGSHQVDGVIPFKLEGTFDDKNLDDKLRREITDKKAISIIEKEMGCYFYATNKNFIFLKFN